MVNVDLIAQAKIARANGAAGLARQLEAMAKAQAESLPMVAAPTAPIVFTGRSDAELATLQGQIVAEETLAEDAARSFVLSIKREFFAALAKTMAGQVSDANLTALFVGQLAESGDVLVADAAPIAASDVTTPKIGRGAASAKAVAAELRAEKLAKAETSGLRSPRKVAPVAKNTPIPALRAHLTMAKAAIAGTRGKQRVAAKARIAAREAALATALAAAGLDA